MGKNITPTVKQSYMNELRVYESDKQHTTKTKLIHIGESNSKVSDIQILFMNNRYLFIEVKMEFSRACGQFVVLLDLVNKLVKYKSTSDCELTDSMEIVLQTLNDMVKAGKISFDVLLDKKIDLEIPVSSDVGMTFTKERYMSIGVCAMSAQYKGKDIKFPIDKLDKYANVKMFFRYHASGSNTTFAGDDFVQYFIEQNASYEVFRDVNDYWSKKISSDGSKYVYVKTDAVWPNKRRKTLYYIHNGEKYLFRIIPDMPGVWKVSKCSKTNNPCIEARIEFIREQDSEDEKAYYEIINGDRAPAAGVVFKTLDDNTTLTI